MDEFVSRKKLKTTENEDEKERKGVVVLNLGNESQVKYIPNLFSFHDSSAYLDFLNNHIPWTRPTIRVFGRSLPQPRDTCYVASAGITELEYSGYKPQAYPWDDFPPLKEIREAVHEALPGSYFNSVLLNRYQGGDDSVGWHADDEKLYGPTPEIASVSFGCERDFLLKKRPDKTSKGLFYYHVRSFRLLFCDGSFIVNNEICRAYCLLTTKFGEGVYILRKRLRCKPSV